MLGTYIRVHLFHKLYLETLFKYPGRSKQQMNEHIT